MNFLELLRNHQFSLTESRITLLKTLSASELPLSEKEIEKQMQAHFNRTTIYRNLNSLSEKGIIQRIVSDDCIKYKLNVSLLNNHHEPDHIHFKCKECNRVICLEDLKVQDYSLPEGFDKIENHFLIVGICRECNERQN